MLYFLIFESCVTNSKFSSIAVAIINLSKGSPWIIGSCCIRSRYLVFTGKIIMLYWLQIFSKSVIDSSISSFLIVFFIAISHKEAMLRYTLSLFSITSLALADKLRLSSRNHKNAQVSIKYITYTP